MVLYKLLNENEIQKYKGGFVVVDNRIYTNPTEETVRKAGFKELADGPVPEINPAEEYIERTYTDGDKITAVYTAKKLEVTEDE